MKDTIIPEEVWHNLANQAAEVGRWIWNIEGDLINQDPILEEMLDFKDVPKPFNIDFFIQHVHEEDQERTAKKIQAVMDNTDTFHADFRFITPQNRELWLIGSGKVYQSEHGLRYLIGVNYDITPLKIKEKHAHLVSREMAHKLRNQMAVVSGLFRMSCSEAESLSQLEQTFSERLQALTQFNELLFDDKEGTFSSQDVFDLAISVCGGEVQINKQTDQLKINRLTAQTLYLVTSELITNSMKYGALRSKQGEVELTFEVSHNKDGISSLIWLERDSQLKDIPQSEGFGMTVLKSMPRATFGGKPQLDWVVGGLDYRCQWLTDRIAVK